MKLRRLPSVERAAALVLTAATLLATSRTPCFDAESASFTAETTCGAAGALTLSFSGGDHPGCSGCWAFLEAPGANAVGLPEQGEIDTLAASGSETRPTSAFEGGSFALVGEAPVAGASPPRSVRRTCRFATTPEPGVLTATCTGADPEAACGGTLTRLPAGGALP